MASCRTASRLTISHSRCLKSLALAVPTLRWSSSIRDVYSWCASDCGFVGVGEFVAVESSGGVSPRLAFLHGPRPSRTPSIMGSTFPRVSAPMVGEAVGCDIPLLMASCRTASRLTMSHSRCLKSLALAVPTRRWSSSIRAVYSRCASDCGVVGVGEFVAVESSGGVSPRLANGGELFPSVTMVSVITAKDAPFPSFSSPSSSDEPSIVVTVVSGAPFSFTSSSGSSPTSPHFLSSSSGSPYA